MKVFQIYMKEEERFNLFLSIQKSCEDAIRKEHGEEYLQKVLKDLESEE